MSAPAVPNTLPISPFLPQISSTLANHSNLVLQAEPGAGKSTALPISLLEADWLQGKKIVMLEPRRVAAKSIAHYLAAQLGEKVGQRIGYQIRNERRVSKNTVLEIVTEGILTRRLQNDPEIDEIGLIIFDEFHERTLQGDLSLLLALEIQQALRDDLKLLVMSATIDTQMIATYLGGAEVISCPGRGFPVTVEYLNSRKERLSDQVATALQQALKQDSSGDLLVFLPGQGEINRAIEAAQTLLDPAWLLLPLYGALSLAQQEQALQPDPQGRRRVVFTTNIAETSLTIEGITTVIDAGLEKTLIYDPGSAMTRLETVAISKASAEQRAGRAGRTQAGHCIRLWSEDKQRSLQAFQPEEILTADLSGLLLELYHWGSNDYAVINWLTAPPQAHFDSAKAMLEALAMLTDNRLTDLGSQAVSSGLPPRLAAMLLRAEGEAEQSLACELAALLADRDIFHNSKGADLSERLLAVQEYKNDRKQALQSYPLKRAAVEQLLQNARNYRNFLGLPVKAQSYSLSDIQTSIGRLLLYAYPDRLAKQRGSGSGRYQLANGRGVFLYEDDPLWGSDYLVVAECDAQKREGRIYTAALISEQEIFNTLAAQLQKRQHYSYEPERDRISGREVLCYQKLKLKSVNLGEMPADQFQACLPDLLQEHGLKLLNWSAACETLLQRIQWLSQYIESFPALSKSWLQEHADEWLLPYLSGINSVAGLKRLNLLELLKGILSWEEQQLLEREAPINYTAPSGRTFSITYDAQQGPIVSLQLQELFGEVDTPKIAAGKVAIRFELLSPARRPIQTTSDLGNFWRSSYFEVVKEMRGRYPKHRWPEEPLKEKAGRSIKPKA